MPHASKPAIHDVTAEAIEVKLIPGQLLTVGFVDDDSPLTVGNLYVAGDDDRERLENLLAIAGRIRQAALDLFASLDADYVAQVHSTVGAPPHMPAAAPMHGTTVRTVRA